ncbi:hypothetical protein PybrP1_010219 [[Pythium] brassicae (nom. inval.)]|nr:hypothetical protein PybrP1_010219 [[Pythium] brassicae (nom. inval.)]
MLRRFDKSGDAPSRPPAPPLPPSTGAQQPSGAEQMSSLQRYRSQTMKDYGLMIEYKHLRQHVPGGIYVLPSFDETRVWFGTIFIHTGLYRNGIFKFTIFLPDNYNGPGTYPRIVFNTSIFHPYVYAELQSRELDLTPKFPEWDPELHYMVAVLTYLKSIFYMKDFPPAGAVANPAALELFRQKDDNEYIARVERCVEESLENVYNNEQGSTIRFTKHNPAHDNLRKELFAQLDPAAPGNSEVRVREKTSCTADTEPLEEKSAGVLSAASARAPGSSVGDDSEAAALEAIAAAAAAAAEAAAAAVSSSSSIFQPPSPLAPASSLSSP